MSRAFLVALVLLLSGCFGVHAPAPTLYDYRIDYPPPAVAASAPLPVVVRVARFTSASIYDREAIIYRDGEYRAGAYLHHRWLTNPASMLGDLLVRDMIASGLYRLVQQGFVLGGSDYDVFVRVEEIEERVGKPYCTAHLQLRLLLRRNRGALPVIFQNAYAADETCAGAEAVDFVAAMSRAAARASGEMQRDIYAAIARDLAEFANSP